jgi:hypothetical protein
MQSLERRRDVRARISLPMTLLRCGHEEPVRMLDASFRGLFVRLASPPPVRSLVKLRIRLPSGDLVVHAVIVRTVQDALGRAAVGLRFFALNGDDRMAWEAYLSAYVAASRAA